MIENSGYSFSSVQVNFPEEESKKIIEWSKKNIKESDLVVNDRAKGRETEVHVTVLYGLHTTNLNTLKLILEKFKPFEIKVGKISKFKSDEYDVLKFEISDGVLRKMNKALKELDHTSNFNVYQAHCTLAYVRKGCCDHLLGKTPFDYTIKVDKVTFSPSKGKKVKVSL